MDGRKTAIILRKLRAGGQDCIDLAQVGVVAGLTDPWSFSLSHAMAPQPIFAAELPTLLQIWKSHEPAFAADVRQSLKGMSTVRQMLGSAITARETIDYNASPAWDQAIGALGSEKPRGAPADDGAVRLLVSQLSADTGHPWRVVSASEFK